VFYGHDLVPASGERAAGGTAKAQKLAERVSKTQKEYDFEPLKASERRIIHLAVAEFDDVTTYTIGDGLLRKVVISPKTSATDAMRRGILPYFRCVKSSPSFKRIK